MASNTENLEIPFRREYKCSIVRAGSLGLAYIKSFTYSKRLFDKSFSLTSLTSLSPSKIEAKTSEHAARIALWASNSTNPFVITTSEACVFLNRTIFFQSLIICIVANVYSVGQESKNTNFIVYKELH